MVAGVASALPAEPRWAGDGGRALGYVRLALGTEPESFARCTAEIERLCAAHGLQLAGIAHDSQAPRSRRRSRPGLRWALEELAAERSDTLVVAELRHLCDTASDLPVLLRWFATHQRRLVAIDFRLDTATEAGALAAQALADVGEWERERLMARTRAGLDAARATSPAQGRAAVADVPALDERIRRLHDQGMTLQAIADLLNEEGVPTLRGGQRWRPSSVQVATGYRRPSSGRRIDLPRPEGEAPA